MGVQPQADGLAFLTEPTAPADVVIPDDMGEDERLLMRTIQEFAAQEVVPLLDQIEQRDESVVLSLFRKAADLGIFMAEVPEEHGGLGLSVLAIAGMSESRSALGGLASTVFAHQGIGTLPLINFGTPAQIEKYLSRCMDGTLMAAFALTEPSSGSDAMNIKTTATLDPSGDVYVVNGSKQWITNAGWADVFILFAKVDGTHFTAFLLERETAGLTVGGHEHLLGLHGSSVCALNLDDVRIPAGNVLGEVGKGHKVALCTLNLGRMKMAANCAGTAKKALALATEYASERQQFGQLLTEFGLIQRKLAEMAARAYAAESVAYRTAGLVYARAEAATQPSLDLKLKALAEFAAECAMSKVFGSETCHALADELLQVFGGNGFSEDYPAARMYRDTRITRIYEGTSEICRLSVRQDDAQKSRGWRARSQRNGRVRGRNRHRPRRRHARNRPSCCVPYSIWRPSRAAGRPLRPRGTSRERQAAIPEQSGRSRYRALRGRECRAEGTKAPEHPSRRRPDAGRRPGSSYGRPIDWPHPHRGHRDSDRHAHRRALRDQLVGLERRMPLPDTLVALRCAVAREIIGRRGQLPRFDR